MSTIEKLFGVKTRQPIEVSKVCPLGRGTNVQANPNFRFNGEIVRRVLNNINRRQPIWIWGPSGCGKTELMRQFAARLNRKCHIISFGEETSLRELLGSYELKQGDSGVTTQYQHGTLVNSMKDDYAIVVLDEFNMAPPGVTAQLNRLLEANEITIPETSEQIKTGEGVVFVATANTAGGVDATGIYSGSQVQNGATRNRFVGLKIGYLEPDIEEELIRSEIQTPNGKTIDDIINLGSKSTSKVMVSVANAIRSLIEEGRASQPFSVRTLKNWGISALSNGSICLGFRDAYLDLLDPHEVLAVNELFTKITGMNAETGLPASRG